MVVEVDHECEDGAERDDQDDRAQQVAPLGQPGAVADHRQRQDRPDEEQPQDRRGYPRIDARGDSTLVQVNGLVERLDERGHQVSLLRHLRLGLGDGPHLRAVVLPTAGCWPRASPDRMAQPEAARTRGAGSESRSTPVPAGTRLGDTLSRIAFASSSTRPRRVSKRSDAMPMVIASRNASRARMRADEDARRSLLDAGRSRLVPVPYLEADLIGDEGDHREDGEDQEDRHVLEGIDGGHRCGPRDG